MVSGWKAAVILWVVRGKAQDIADTIKDMVGDAARAAGRMGENQLAP